MANFVLSYDLNGPNPSHKQMDGRFTGDVRLEDRQKGGHLKIIHDNGLSFARGAIHEGQNLHLMADAAFHFLAGFSVRVKTD